MREVHITVGQQHFTVREGQEPPLTRLVPVSPGEGITVGGPNYHVAADVYGQEALLAAELDDEGRVMLAAVVYDENGDKVGQIWQNTWMWIFPTRDYSEPKYAVKERENVLELVSTEDQTVRARLIQVDDAHYVCEGVFYAPTGDCLVVSDGRVVKNPK